MQELSIGPVENLVRCNGPRRINVPLASAPLALARYLEMEILPACLLAPHPQANFILVLKHLL